MKKARIKRMLLKLSNIFCYVFSALFWGFLVFGFEDEGLAITTLICALIHEMGHAVCILLTRAKDLKLKAVLNGLKFKHSGVRSYNEEILIYLSGPLFNLLTAIFCVIFTITSGKDLWTIAVINLATALSNLMPIKGNDGYGALVTIMKKRECDDLYFRVLSCVSSALIFSTCVFSLYLIDRLGGGYWIFCVFFSSMLREIKDGLNR